MKAIEELEDEINRLKHDNQLLEKDVEFEKWQLHRTEDKLFETKVQRIAMGEITQTTKESLFREMGYVVCFHGYPDFGEPKPLEKEEG